MAKTKNKTPEEIGEWLKNQKWIREFVRTMRDSHTSRKTATQILNGELGALTLAAGFGWEDSPQGLKYWHNKHKEFIEWYYG